MRFDFCFEISVHGSYLLVTDIDMITSIGKSTDVDVNGNVDPNVVIVVDGDLQQVARAPGVTHKQNLLGSCCCGAAVGKLLLCSSCWEAVCCGAVVVEMLLG